MISEDLHLLYEMIPTNPLLLETFQTSTLQGGGAPSCCVLMYGLATSVTTSDLLGTSYKYRNCVLPSSQPGIRPEPIQLSSTIPAQTLPSCVNVH